MIKEIFDRSAALILLILASPLLLFCLLGTWLYDWHSPFYIASRVGRNGIPFKMIKIRSMKINADKTGVDSTSANDDRITPIGHFIRKCKVDELSQLINVLKGDMSFVGPRPNVKRETDLYTQEEQTMLTMKPGITDIASITFADEGDILQDSQDPDIDYNQLIRPWKSRLAILYVQHSSFFLDLKIIFLTALMAINRQKSLESVGRIVLILSGDKELSAFASRQRALIPTPPPGMDTIVTSRKIADIGG